jgi:D-alanine-D-alanine ligase-like ATP-grasp enzyme
VPFLLEVNTLPGLNSHSVFVKASGLAGMDYDSVIGKIINA